MGRDYWKPHPKSFEIMKEHFHVDYSEMMYIGDNPRKDFYISSIYPILTVRIIRKDGQYLNAKYLNGCREKVIVNNLLEIREVLSNE